MGGHVHTDLQHYQQYQAHDRGAERHYQEPARDQYYVQYHYPCIRLLHQVLDRGLPVLASPEVVVREREAVARDQRDCRPSDSRRRDRIAEHPGTGVIHHLHHACAEECEHEDTVHEGEHPVVEREERDHEHLPHPATDVGGTRHRDLENVVAPDDHVLEPEQEDYGKHLPPQERHAVERDEVGQDEHDGRRREPPVEIGETEGGHGPGSGGTTG